MQALVGDAARALLTVPEGEIAEQWRDAATTPLEEAWRLLGELIELAGPPPPGSPG